MTKSVAFLLYLNVSYITHCLELYLNQMENELCMVILVLEFQSMIVVEYIIIVMGCCMSSN